SEHLNQPVSQPRISLSNVTVTSDESFPILKDISLEVTPGKLTCIIGPVGSGKSATLLTILNELPIAKGGSVEVSGSMIYASQVKPSRLLKRFFYKFDI